MNLSACFDLFANEVLQDSGIFGGTQFCFGFATVFLYSSLFNKLGNMILEKCVGLSLFSDTASA